MSKSFVTKPLFDWLGRPFEELWERLKRLRSAATEQSLAIERLLTERELQLAKGKEELPRGGGLSESCLDTGLLDLRVRSALIREGSSGPIRQEMAEIVSLLGLHRKLDRISDRAYEVVAAAEHLLDLLRGDGWVFAHNDILAWGEEAEQEVEAYRERVAEAHKVLEREAEQLEQQIARQLEHYQIARFGFLVLLFLGPLVGLWSGLQLGYGQAPPRPPKLYVPHRIESTLRMLARGDRLIPSPAGIGSRAWSKDSPSLQLRQLMLEMGEDLEWLRLLCERLEKPAVLTRSDAVLAQQCREVLVAQRESQRSMRALGELLAAQDALRLEILRGALGSVPPRSGEGKEPGTPVSGPTRQEKP